MNAVSLSNRKELLSSKISDITQADYSGAISPHAIELESSVLGAIILEKDALTFVAEILRPESFYVEANQEIYKAIVQLFNSSEPIDIRTVVNQLRKNGKLEFVGGAYYIASLTSQVGSASNIEYHARALVEFSIRRDIIAVSTAIQKKAYDNTNDVFDLLNAAEQSLFEITNANIRKSYQEMSVLLLDAVKQIEQSRNKRDGLTGVPSGFTALDRVTSGWQKSDLIIVAARPGMGKTAFILSVLRNAAVDHECPVAIFSLEMSSAQLVNRLISAETEIENQAIKKGRLDNQEWEKLIKKTSMLSKAPIFIDDTPALSIFELRAKCRRLKSKYNVQLIVVDYLQLMCGEVTNKASNREQEIASISRALKNIAKELNVPVIACAQLSRAVENRGGNKKPQLSDLRESGGIEQDADIVTLLYRPEYYGITEDENGNSTQGLAELIIAKHRNGALETIKIQYNNRCTKFTDFDQFDYNQTDSRELSSITQGSKMNDLEFI